MTLTASCSGRERRACQVRPRQVLAGIAIALLFRNTAPAQAEDLPVDARALERLEESSGGRAGVTNLLSYRQVYDAVRDGDGRGLAVDFSHLTALLDGTEIDPGKLYGDVWTGPYPFEADETGFTYKRFRVHGSVRSGKATIDLRYLLAERTNSERWTSGGRVAVRFRLFLESAERDRDLGVHDTAIQFERAGDRFVKRPGVAEGPFVSLVNSDAPGSAVISFVTYEEVRAHVELTDEAGGVRTYWDDVAMTRHEIALDGLEPEASYRYRVIAGGTATREYALHAAPRADARRAVRFAYFGDSREGSGGGLASHMGVNHETLVRHARIAQSSGAEFLIVGGDLVNGYTTVPEDFETQLHAWRDAMTGLWNERPIYAAMGNHEALLRQYTNGVRIDRWPYDTESAEAVFARIFVHPQNGPALADERRPTYEENVYSFRFGCLKVIAFNNNYWVSYSSDRYGGSPEGYLLPDQLEWIAAELDEAEKDATVRYVILFAQEPVFPNGGHVADSMWHGGDNRVRAHVYRDDKLLPEEDGILVVRDRFVRLIASHRKVAAVLGSDEHGYHRTLIGKEVPVGDIRRDDRNLNGRIDTDAGEEASPLDDLRYRAWYVVCGGGGAPYYAEEDTPWNRYWQDRTTPRSGITGFYYSSQENILLFDAGPERIGFEVRSVHGEVIDRVEDLMADKE